MNIKRFWFKAKPKQEPHMKHFSEEYRQKLIAEHKLVSATIQQMTQMYPRYVQNNSADAVAAAISDYKIKKIQLEGQIDVLTEFLR